jgi:tetratricopeptide (TPR) repeat protein
MTPADPHDDRLAELRRRWEEDPGSRLFLQLAEEYRRDERREEALEVLRKGLEAHPQQVSGLVSLGRLQLEMGKAAEASRALEKAVSIDPTNLVAMKLAVEAYLERGERDEARQRLELYKILNAGDPDVEALEARVAGRAPEAPPAGVASAPDETGAYGGETPDEGETAGAAAAAEPEPTGTPAWSATAAWPGLPREAGSAAGTVPPFEEPGGAEDEIFAAGGWRVGGSQEAAAQPAESREAAAMTAPVEEVPAPAGGRPDPFGDLAAPGDRHRYLAGLGAEGIFPLELEPEPQPEPAAPPAAPEREAPPPQPEAPFAAPPYKPEEPAAPWRLDDEAEPAAAVAAPLPGDRPTVTLGQLYLDQGHPGEALRIFEAVLARDPEHAQARDGQLRAEAALTRSGYAAAAPPVGSAPPHAFAAAAPLPGEAPDVGTGAAGFPLTAADLLAGAGDAQPPRQALLHAYLDRLRGRRRSS